jgi:hypothetical protein
MGKILDGNNRIVDGNTMRGTRGLNGIFSDE